MDKLAGLATQVRDLKRRLKEMDTKKANPAKIKEITDVIKDLEKMLEDKKQKQEERKRKKEEVAKAEPKVEAAPQIPEVAKESAPVAPEVTKESTVEKFAIDSKVEPIRGTPGSWGVVIREAGINGDPLVYVKWNEGHLKEAHGEYGAYYPSDLRLKAEVVAEAKDPTQYVPREQLYNLEADLKSNYERMIVDLQEEIKTATDKGEAAWAHRLEQKLSDIKKTYDEKYNKTAEDENGSGGTERLKVVDMNPPYDKDPQEKATGYGGDRPMGAMVAPNSDENSLPLESSAHIGWNVYLDGKKIDKVFYVPTATAEEIKKGLVDHDNYDPRITVKKEASLKFADLDLESIDKRWALYVDGKLAIRTLTRQKAEKIAKERFPQQVAAGKYEIKREDHTPVVAELKPMNINVGSSFYNVNPLPKPSMEEFEYDVLDSMGTQLFKITAKQELDQEHLSKIIETELTNKKEASNKCAICNEEFASWAEYDAHKKEKHSPKMAKLVSNLAFLKKGSIVSILNVDKTKKQVKFASLDGSLRGWAPMQKFAAMEVPSANLVDHEGHKDEVLAESGHELLVSCPANSTNIIWREITAPPTTPESLNPDVTAKAEFPGGQCAGCGKDLPTVWGATTCKECWDKGFRPASTQEKKAAGCDQCNAAMINGVFCHETGCPNAPRKCRHGKMSDVCSVCSDPFEGEGAELEASLNKDAHIRHEDGKWVIYSHDYKKKLGEYPTESAAKKRLSEIEFFKHQGSMNPLSKKEAGVMDTKCEECGEPLGPEVFLSKWPVCGKCTKKRHEKAVGKKADQDLSLEQHVQNFKDRMSAVTERLANPPAKTADLETTQDLSKVDVKDLSEGILHMIDMLESKVGEDVSANPEIHGLLEELENKVWDVEMKLGIRPTLPEHEKTEPEHKEIVEEVAKESAVEVKSDNVNTPPSTLPPAGFRYAWDPKNMTWILVQISDAPGGGY